MLLQSIVVFNFFLYLFTCLIVLEWLYCCFGFFSLNVFLWNSIYSGHSVVWSLLYDLKKKKKSEPGISQVKNVILCLQWKYWCVVFFQVSKFATIIPASEAAADNSFVSFLTLISSILLDHSYKISCSSINDMAKIKDVKVIFVTMRFTCCSYGNIQLSALLRKSWRRLRWSEMSVPTRKFWPSWLYRSDTLTTSFTASCILIMTSGRAVQALPACEFLPLSMSCLPLSMSFPPLQWVFAPYNEFWHVFNLSVNVTVWIFTIIWYKFTLHETVCNLIISFSFLSQVPAWYQTSGGQVSVIP